MHWALMGMGSLKHNSPCLMRMVTSRPQHHQTQKVKRVYSGLFLLHFPPPGLPGAGECPGPEKGFRFGEQGLTLEWVLRSGLFFLRCARPTALGKDPTGAHRSGRGNNGHISFYFGLEVS